jgi:hypothetical protein
MALAIEMFTTVRSWIAFGIVMALVFLFGVAGAIGRRQDERAMGDTDV